jgi:hypothetical protein
LIAQLIADWIQRARIHRRQGVTSDSRPNNHTESDGKRERGPQFSDVC